jgi:hypothetical protein
MQLCLDWASVNKKINGVKKQISTHAIIQLSEAWRYILWQ